MAFVPVLPPVPRRESFKERFLSALAGSLGTLPANLITTGAEFGLSELGRKWASERQAGLMREMFVREQEAKALEEAKKEREQALQAAAIGLLLGGKVGSELGGESPLASTPWQPSTQPVSPVVEKARMTLLAGEQPAQAEPLVVPPQAPQAGADASGSPTPPTKQAQPGIPEGVQRYSVSIKRSYQTQLPGVEPEGLAEARRDIFSGASAAGREMARTMEAAGRLRREAEWIADRQRALAIDYARRLANLSGQPAEMYVHGSWVDFAKEEAEKGREVDPQDPGDVERFMKWSIDKAKARPGEESVIVAAVNAAAPYIAGLLSLRERLISGVVPAYGQAQAFVANIDESVRRISAGLAQTVLEQYAADKRAAMAAGAQRQTAIALEAMRMLPLLNDAREILVQQIEATPPGPRRDKLAQTLSEVDLTIAAMSEKAGLGRAGKGLIMPPTMRDVEAAASAGVIGQTDEGKWQVTGPEQAARLRPFFTETITPAAEKVTESKWQQLLLHGAGGERNPWVDKAILSDAFKVYMDPNQTPEYKITWFKSVLNDNQGTLQPETVRILQSFQKALEDQER